MSEMAVVSFQYEDGRTAAGDVLLPYDKNNAELLRIEDREYALFYRSVFREPECFEGKRVTSEAKLMAAGSGELTAGREMLVCCMNDLVPAYFVCVKVPKDTPVPGCWVKLTGVLHARYHELYKQKGAVIAVETIEQCCALVREEAVF